MISPGHRFLHLILPHSALQHAFWVEQAGAMNASCAKLQASAEGRCHQQEASMAAPSRVCTPNALGMPKLGSCTFPSSSCSLFVRYVSELSSHCGKEENKAARQETERHLCMARGRGGLVEFEDRLAVAEVVPIPKPLSLRQERWKGSATQGRKAGLWKAAFWRHWWKEGIHGCHGSTLHIGKRKQHWSAHTMSGDLSFDGTKGKISIREKGIKNFSNRK